MPACPVCHGEGHHDLRDTDAFLSEHFLDLEPVGIVPCDECESTGIVSQERRDTILAASLERVYAIIEQVERIDALEAALDLTYDP